MLISKNDPNPAENQTLLEIVHFSFMERFEYVFIFIWLLVIIPPMCISMWACTRIAKKRY